MRTRLIPAGVAVAVGAGLAAQSRVNGELAIRTGSSLEAAIVSFGSGLVILCVALVSVPRWRAATRGLARSLRSAAVPWWWCLGGLAGGWFVATQGIAVPLVGVAVFSVAFVAGQTASALVVDRVGLGPGGRRPVTGLRVTAAAIAVAAIAVAVSDRLTGTSAGAWWPVLLVLSAGVGNAAQQAVNGRVAVATGAPVVAAWVNFLVGTVALGLAFAVAAIVGSGGPAPLPTGPWWCYLGGPIGVAFIAGAAWVVRPLGVLLFALLSIVGQLGAAIVLDQVAPTAGASTGWHLYVGMALTGAAVVLAGARR